MDSFAIVLFAGLAALILWVWVLGRSTRGGGATRGTDPLGLRSPRQIVEERDALEDEDLTQLLEATNARRRARGLPERSREQAQRELGSGGTPGN